jgi:hypothetical protein
MKYVSRWTAGMGLEETQRFEELLGVNNKVLDRLVTICYNMLNELEKESNDFNSPNWAMRQANLVGQKAALSKIITLCTPTPERDSVPA